MFKNMKLAAKIGMGFAALVLIACALGGLAVVNMNTVKTVAMGMQNEHVPSVKVANNVERTSLLTMYEARGYALTEEDKYKKTAQKHLQEVMDFLKEAKTLATERKIDELKTAAEKAEVEAKHYGELFTQTSDAIALLDADRAKMNESAAAYMKVCAEFLESQSKALEKEITEGAAADKLKERVEKLAWCNDVIDYGNAVRIAAWRSQALRDPKVIEDAQANFPKIDAKLDDLKKITHLPEDLKDIEQCRKDGHAYRDAMLSLLKNWKELQAIGVKRTEVGQNVLKEAKATAEFGMGKTTTGAENAASSLSSASTTMVIGLTVGVIIGILLAIFITRSITLPINKVIEGLTSGSEQVSSASGQVSSSSQQLAQGASEQASSLEETSSALEEMASMTRQNADNASKADGLMKEAKRTVENGVGNMTRMTAAIDKIKTSASETAKIIKTIDEIAFQTNLLALNAAVEAARAGEAGKGFAVVAEEVRNLARRSAEAAKNTADLIEGAQKNADEGVSVTNDVAKALTEIQESSGKVAVLVSEIAAASKEQAQGIEQVNTAVAEMDKVVQQNAANAEESSSASEELSSQAQEMNGIVGELTSIVNGANNVNNNQRQIEGPRHSGAKKIGPIAHIEKKASRQAPKKLAGSAKPEEVIPLDDEELSKF